MPNIAGSLINFRVRPNGTAEAFKNVICIENTTFEITNETAERRTNCGPITSVADATFSATGSAVHDFDPSATQVSYNDVKTWQKNKTKLDFQYYNSADAGNGISENEAVDIEGSGFFTTSSYNASAEADGLGGFDFTFTGTGTLDEFDAS